MLTHTDSYAIRLMTFFAKHPTKFITSADLTDANEISDLSPSYVAKICQRLARGGLLTSQRGLKGGFRLVQPAPTLEAILASIGDTVHDMQICPLHPSKGSTCHCPLALAREPFVAYLRSATV